MFWGESSKENEMGLLKRKEIVRMGLRVQRGETKVVAARLEASEGAVRSLLKREAGRCGPVGRAPGNTPCSLHAVPTGVTQPSHSSPFGNMPSPPPRWICLIYNALRHSKSGMLLALSVLPAVEGIGQLHV